MIGILRKMIGILRRIIGILRKTIFETQSGVSIAVEKKRYYYLQVITSKLFLTACNWIYELQIKTTPKDRVDILFN